MLPQKITRSQQVYVVSPLVEIYDLPGIDDAVESVRVNSFIEKNKEYIIPVIIFPLTGGILDTVQFSNLIETTKKDSKVIVVFTHLENLITGTKHLIVEDEE